MEPNHLGPGWLVIVTSNGIAYLDVQLLDGIGFREDGHTESARGVAAFRRLLDDEDDFAHDRYLARFCGRSPAEEITLLPCWRPAFHLPMLYLAVGLRPHDGGCPLDGDRAGGKLGSHGLSDALVDGLVGQATFVTNGDDDLGDLCDFWLRFLFHGEPLRCLMTVDRLTSSFSAVALTFPPKSASALRV